MQRPKRDKATSLKELPPQQSHRRGAEAIAHEASINAYYSAQKPTVIGQNPFDSLPSELILNIIVNNHLPSSDARQFVHAFPSLFYMKPKLQPFLKSLNDKVGKFFLYVMNSNVDAARLMLEKDPGLILVEHSVGEHKHVTALQLAKDMSDVGMCKMLLRRLKSYDLQCSRFLDCVVDHTSTQIAKLSTSKVKTPFDIKNFGLIADAIAKYSSDAGAELTRHRTGRKTKLSNDMDEYRASVDLHGEFTIVDLINVYEVLLINGYKLLTLQQFDLFFLQVMGYVERKLPMCLRMALNQGIQFIMQNYYILQNNSVAALIGAPRVFLMISSIPLSILPIERSPVSVSILLLIFRARVLRKYTNLGRYTGVTVTSPSLACALKFSSGNTIRTC